MFDHRVRLPLAFLLAMSAADGGSKVRALVKQDETVLRRGVLTHVAAAPPYSPADAVLQYQLRVLLPEKPQ